MGDGRGRSRVEGEMSILFFQGGAEEALNGLFDGIFLPDARSGKRAEIEIKRNQAPGLANIGENKKKTSAVEGRSS
jgi:hypothetical protein